VQGIVTDSKATGDTERRGFISGTAALVSLFAITALLVWKRRKSTQYHLRVPEEVSDDLSEMTCSKESPRKVRFTLPPKCPKPAQNLSLGPEEDLDEDNGRDEEVKVAFGDREAWIYWMKNPLFGTKKTCTSPGTGCATQSDPSASANGPTSSNNNPEVAMYSSYKWIQECCIASDEE
jgi:hypothetical protein